MFLLNVLVLTHFPGPFVVYIVINLLAVLLLRVVKLASRKHRKDYGVLRSNIREFKLSDEERVKKAC